MNNDLTAAITDMLGKLFADAAKTNFSDRTPKNPVDDIIDVESEIISKAKYTAAMPVKAIFNVKTEEEVPVLDENGKPVIEAGRIVKTTKKLERPVLASKVFFEDGSWTVVKNSGEDTIDLTEVKLPNGKIVVTATDASKERALAYAVVKHAFGHVDPKTREVYGANLGRRFEKVIKASVDQRVSAASRSEKKAEPAKKSRACGGSCRSETGKGRVSREDVKNLIKDVMLGLAGALGKNDKGLDLDKRPEGA